MRDIFPLSRYCIYGVPLKRKLFGFEPPFRSENSYFPLQYFAEKYFISLRKMLDSEILSGSCSRSTYLAHLSLKALPVLGIYSPWWQVASLAALPQAPSADKESHCKS